MSDTDELTLLRMHYGLSEAQARALKLLANQIVVTREDIEDLHELYGSAKQLMFLLRKALATARGKGIEPSADVRSKGYLGWWLDPIDQNKIHDFLLRDAT